MYLIDKVFKNKFIKNSLWLILDKMFLLIGGFIITTMVARYLGPNKLGELTYGLTLSLFCTAISQWGASYTIFNTATSDKSLSISYIESTLLARFYLYILSWFFVSIYLYSTLEQSKALLISLICLSNIFLGLDVYQYYFNGTLQSKINAKASMLAKLITMIIRCLLVFLEFNLWWFIFPLVIEGMIVFFNKKNKLKNDKVYRVNLNIKQYFIIGMPLLCSSIMVIIYTKVNEILLKEYLSFESVGIYSAGLVLANAWTFIPMSLGISYITRALEKGEGSDFSFTYFIVLVVSIPALVVFYLYPQVIINYTYGEDYISLVELLPLMSVTAMISVLSFLNHRHIGSTLNGAKYLYKKIIVTAILSVVITYHLIPLYGTLGAVYSMLFIEFFSLTISNYFFRDINIYTIHLKVFNIFNFKRIYKNE